MTPAEILSLYDRQMRRDRLESPIQRVEALAHLTRVFGDTPGAEYGAILYSALTSQSADAAIAEQIAYFSRIGRAFEWKLYGHDEPADLSDRLVKHGFRQGDAEALLCFSMEKLVSPPPPEISIRRLTSPAGLEALEAMEVAAGNEPNEALRVELRRELTESPQALSVYVAWHGKKPVARAWIRYYAQRDFADLWGGETLREYRKRGIYRALVAIRAEEAATRGVRFLTTDALPTSRPILERMGFMKLTTTAPYLFLPF